ncbi:hypothetical protein DM15PD_18340 (plasmid) [Aristophania vespae]|nr:hypothetical protein DM15PD_18340 [Aristophania vespae]
MSNAFVIGQIVLTARHTKKHLIAKNLINLLA